MNGTNSSAKHYDMVVIGSGAARHQGAIEAANLGKRLWSLDPTAWRIDQAER